MKIKNKKVLVMLTLLLAAAVFLGQTLIPDKNEIIYGGDLSTQFYFWKGFLKYNILKGVIPFWNPYNFSGTPFLAHPGVAPFYPFTLLFVIFPLNLSFSLNYYIHLVIGGLGVFLLAKKYAGSMLSLFSGIAFMYSGFISARIYAGHFDLLTTSVWIPWVIYSFLSISQNTASRRNIILSILSLSLLILAGYSAYLVFVLEFIFFLLIYLFVKKTPKILNISAAFFLVTIISLGITAIQWLPTWELARNSIRGKGLPYELASWGSLPLSAIKLFINPLNRTELNKISFNLGGGPKENPFDHFMGKTPLAFITLFLLYYFFTRFLSKKNLKTGLNSDFWFFLIVCAYFFWVALGNFAKPNLHYFLYSVIPFYRFIRIPIQNLIIPVVLVPVLSAITLSKIKNEKIQMLLSLIIIVELFIFGKNFIFLSDIPEMKYNRGIIEAVSMTPGTGRLLPAFRVVSPFLDRFDLNGSMLYGIETTSGYDPVILKNYYDFIDKGNGNNQSSISYFNVEIPPVDLSKKSAAILNVAKIMNEDGSVYENKNYLPRFYFETDDKCRDENKKIEIIKYSLNNIKLKTSNSCDALIMSSEIYYPGWKASINSKNAAIQVSNNVFRAVFVPKGESTIEYYYYPKVYIYGLFISLLSSIASIFIIKKYYEN